MKQNFEPHPQAPEVYEQYAEQMLIPNYLGDIERETPYSRERRPISDYDPVVCNIKRLPIGSFRGTLGETSPADLGIAVVNEVLQSTNIDNMGDEVDGVIFGNVIQVRSGINVAGTIKNNTAIRPSGTADTIGAACRSSLSAIAFAELEINSPKHPDTTVLIAGGAENMSWLPYTLNDRRDGTRLGDKPLNKIATEDDILVDSLAQSLKCDITGMMMGETAEAIAVKYDVSKKSLDHVAMRSQHLAEMALNAGWRKDTVVPVEVMKDGKPVTLEHDEYVKGSSVTMESLNKLYPAFVNRGEEGRLTAGTSSGINDGASAMIVTTYGRAKELGLEPQMVIRSSAKVGVPPGLMGLGPFPALTEALKLADLEASDLDYAGIHEAFAVVPIVCGADLGIDPNKVNPLGSGIALGHPLAATGSNMAAEAYAYSANKPDAVYFAVSTCVGGGEGMAMIFERV